MASDDMTAEEVADGILDTEPYLSGTDWRKSYACRLLRDRIAAALTAREEAATRAENEACAKVAEENIYVTGGYLAKYIRSRQTPTGGET